MMQHQLSAAAEATSTTMTPKPRTSPRFIMTLVILCSVMATVRAAHFGVRTTTSSSWSSSSLCNNRHLTNKAFVVRTARAASVRSSDELMSSTSSSLPLTTLTRIRGGSTEVMDLDESEEDEESDDEDEETDDEDEQVAAATSSTGGASSKVSTKPLPLTIKTTLGHKVLDQSMELTVNRSRNIASIKDSLRRQLPGRPPVASMELVLHGRRLPDDMLIDELVDDEDDDDDDEEEEEPGASVLILQLDMVPPVDPKFVPQLEQDMDDLTSSELLDAYAANEAALYQNTALLMQQTAKETDMDEDDDDEEESINVDASNAPLLTIQMREQATRLRQDLERTVLDTPNAQKILSTALAPAELRQSQLLQATQVRGQRVRHSAVASVKTSFKRKLQHIWNIDWAESIRYFCLFLFFGWFGGRTATSRAILLLGAPSVFVLQARPVKLALKQLLYTLLDHPPSIFLSLLPAPQQAMLSLNVKEAMQTIYGDAMAGAAAAVDSIDSLEESDDNDDEEFFSAEEDFDDNEEEDDDDLDYSDDEEY